MLQSISVDDRMNENTSASVSLKVTVIDMLYGNTYQELNNR